MQEELKEHSRRKYYFGSENYNVTDTMYAKGALALGAECGITETLKLAFNAKNDKLSLATALNGAWKVPDYWKDPAKKNLAIVQMKLAAEKVISEGFSSPSAQVCMEDIFDILQREPFGLLPNNITAFVLGFIMKEYVSDDYFWSNNTISEPMSVNKMKIMIANVISQTITHEKKYKPEFIRAMSSEQRAFLKCTSEVFDIPESQCGSIEMARDQVRIRMRSLSFPIWTVKSILNSLETYCNSNIIASVIDDYCRIANKANGSKTTESDLANNIGIIVINNENIIDDLSRLLTDDMCQKGMLAYIDSYRDGILKTLAVQINDGGAYIDHVRERFTADEANWVWNTDTANAKIDDVILEYQIVTESAKYLPSCLSMRDVVSGWNVKTNNIKISFEALKKVSGDLAPFLEELYNMKLTNTLPEQNWEKFYSMLISQHDAFDEFYNHQTSYFKQVADVFIEGLESDDIIELYQEIPTGQFTKTSTEYMTYIEEAVNTFANNQAKKRIRDIWYEKTGTKDPSSWSETNNTPILCMIDDADRPEAKDVFSIMLENSPSESSINKALSYLESFTYYDKLADKKERDRCFMERIVGDYALMLNDPDMVREELIFHCTVKPYDWMDNSTVQHQIELLANKKYKTGGSDKVWSVIENMDATELRRYLKNLIYDNVKVGIEILKNK